MIEDFLGIWMLIGLATVVYVCRREGHGALQWVSCVFLMSWLGPVLTVLVWRTYRRAQ